MSPTSNPSSGTSPVVWADPVRQSLFDAWLSQVAPTHRLRVDSVRVASADASFRRYLRVNSRTAACGSLIVMDAPPDKENCEPFVRIAALLHDAGLLAPRVLAWDAPQGFMLLDDLGTQTMMDVIDRDNAVANLPLLFASTALAPLSFMPPWLGWLAAVNPLTFAIEPIRAAYAGQFSLSAVVLQAPYGDVTASGCLGVLALLAVGLFLLIRPLLDRKLS